MRRACPKANSECKLAPNCFSDKHHPDWPAYDYKTPLEREYRETRAIGNYICRAEHDEIHATEQPPLKPPVAEMVAYLFKETVEPVEVERAA